MKKLNPSGFKNFFTSYYERCFLFAKSYVHNDWVAEDIASESLIKLWEISKTREIDNPKTLLFTMVKNKALDYLKHEVIKQNVFNSIINYSKRELDIRISTLEACDPERIFESDIQKIINKTLSNLPQQTRDVFIMNRFQNKSKKEIAEKMRISIKGVDYHISKALYNLRESLQDYF